MKNKLFLLLMGLAALTACDDCLDETDYTYSISSETFYNTVEEANAAKLEAAMKDYGLL